MSFQNATKDLFISKQLASLLLVGGKDVDINSATIGSIRKTGDLRVAGGALVEKNLRIGGTTLVGGNLNADTIVNQTLVGNIAYLDKIIEKSLEDGVKLVGNLVPDENYLYSLGTITNKWKELLVQNVIVDANIDVGNDISVGGDSAIVGGVSIGGDTSIGGNVVIGGDTSIGGNVTVNNFSVTGMVTSNIDMNCFDIQNVSKLYVSNVFGKSPITLNDQCIFRDQCSFDDVCTFDENCVVNKGLYVGNVFPVDSSGIDLFGDINANNNDLTGINIVACDKIAPKDDKLNIYSTGQLVLTELSESVKLDLTTGYPSDLIIQTNGDWQELRIPATANPFKLTRVVPAVSFAFDTPPNTFVFKVYKDGAPQSPAKMPGSGTLVGELTINDWVAGTTIDFTSENVIIEPGFTYTFIILCTTTALNNTAYQWGLSNTPTFVDGVQLTNSYGSGTWKVTFYGIEGFTQTAVCIDGNLKIDIYGNATAHNKFTFENDAMFSGNVIVDGSLSTGNVLLDNTLIGYKAGTSITSGNKNVIVGAQSDVVTANTSECVLVGANAQVSSLVTNAIGIGTDVIASSSNGLFFSTHNTAGSGSTAIWNGDQLQELTSSIRFKTNVRDMEDVGNKIDALKPVRFTPIDNPTKECIGFIAEDMVEVFPEIVTFEADGITPRSIMYDVLVSTLVKEIQSIRKILHQHNLI